MTEHVHRRFRRGPLALAAGLVGVLAFGAVLQRGESGPEEEHIIEHRPSADLPRLDELAEPPFEVDAALVLAFDATPNRLALVDVMSASVTVLRREGSEWVPQVAFGRRGDGPGELRSPHGIALTGDSSIVVADGTRLHFFTVAGEYVRSTEPRTACPLQRPGVAAGASGLFLHGTCMRQRPQTDTVVAALYWSADGDEFVELVTDVRYTRDGGIGSFLGSESPFSEGNGRHLFGAGSANCIHEVRDKAVLPRVERVCDLTAARYRAAPPAALQQRLRRESARRPEYRHLLRWPDALPVYVSAVAAAEHTLLVRPFSADSVVFEVAGSRREVLVAPQDGLLSCRRYGCLWTEHTTDAVRLTLLPIDRIVNAAAPPQ